MMNSAQIMQLDFAYWYHLTNEYHRCTAYKHLGPSDEFVTMYCMGNEL